MNGVYNGGAGGSHHELDPALYAWTEVTGSFLASCQELQLGELLHDDMFGLFEVSFFLSCARSSNWASFFTTICSGFSRWAFFHCCGCGSTWVGIDIAVLDPDSDWECGSRSRSSMEIDQNLQINLIFSLSKRLLYPA
jgi:hypothetical protein